MRSKEVVLIAVLLVMAGCYWKFFMKHGKPTIEITPSFRPPHRGTTAKVFPVLFSLNDTYGLTSVEVYPAETNKAGSTLPLWHLVSKSNSYPTKVLSYGMPIRGMEPAIPRVRPQPLVPDVAYRLVLTAGDLKNEIRFRTKAMPNAN